VAAQSSMDLGNIRYGNMDKSMYGRRSGMGLEDLLLKEKTMMGLQGFQGFQGLTSGLEMPIHHNTILSLEELVQTPLFREYYSIPLFRQFWETYPVAFQKYVKSVLFQQFWTVPAFVQYFKNPVLFYKYIVPQVQLIAQKYETTTTQFGGDFTTQGFNFDRRNMMNVNILDKLFGGYTTDKWMTPMITREQQGIYGQSTTGLDFQTKYLLEKMIKNLILNGENKKVEETLTDVRVLNNGQVKETTVGKIVDPITGEQKITLGDIKVNIRTILNTEF
jgi:hypothetical protein